MDSYLELAQRVLASTRRPLTPREIIRAAYVDGLVPRHLYGKTQHKTLGARLSEDILLRRDRSTFFRPSPGKYFLTDLISDEQIPEQYRRPIVSRRRKRDLVRDDVLTVRADIQAGCLLPSGHKLLEEANLAYRQIKSPMDNLTYVIWSFVLVTKGSKILSYRAGRYREDRDELSEKRSIGFYAPVQRSALDLFSVDDLGIVMNGVRTVVTDLDIPLSFSKEFSYRDVTSLIGFFLPQGSPVNTLGQSLLAITLFECPSWFEPVGRRLAINDLCWIDSLSQVNNLDDFDVWSHEIIENITSLNKILDVKEDC